MCKGQDQRWYIAGVASFGHNECGAPHKYGIYAKIASAVDWITNNTGIVLPTNTVNDFTWYNDNNGWNPFG